MENPSEPIRHHGGNPVFALVVICIGIVLLLKNLGIIDEAYIHNLWRLWPVLLILLGLRSLAPQGSRANAAYFIIALILIGAGAILLTDIRLVHGTTESVRIIRY